MSKVLTDKQNYVDIANAIRNKGVSGTFKPNEMADAISNISSGSGVIPTGKKVITNTNEVDVTNYATAQIVDANLKAENIANGINVLGIIGTHQGSGGEYIEFFESIMVDGMPNITKYVDGERFNSNGMSIVAKFRYGLQKYINDYNISPSVLSLGASSVTVSYTLDGVTKTAIVPIEVLEVTKIEITTPPTKVEYIEGDNFDATGMVVTATCSDGSTKNITIYTYTPIRALTTDDNTITVSYGSFSDTINITVKNKMTGYKHSVTIRNKNTNDFISFEFVNKVSSNYKSAYDMNNDFSSLDGAYNFDWKTGIVTNGNINGFQYDDSLSDIWAIKSHRWNQYLCCKYGSISEEHTVAFTDANATGANLYDEKWATEEMEFIDIVTEV